MHKPLHGRNKLKYNRAVRDITRVVNISTLKTYYLNLIASQL